MNIDDFLHRKNIELNQKGVKIKLKVEAYEARMYKNTFERNADRLLNANMSLSPEEKRRKNIMYNKYIKDNDFRGNFSRSKTLRKYLDSSYETKIENLMVEAEEEAEEFYDDFSKDLYDEFKKEFERSYIESKKQVIENVVDNPFYDENSIQVSEDYIDKAITEKYGENDISFDKAVYGRKMAFERILRE